MKPTSLITWNEIYQKIGQMKEREKERNPGEGSQEDHIEMELLLIKKACDTHVKLHMVCQLLLIGSTLTLSRN